MKQGKQIQKHIKKQTYVLMPHFINAYIYFQYSLVHLMAFKLRDKLLTVVLMLSTGENELRTWQRNWLHLSFVQT